MPVPRLIRNGEWPSGPPPCGKRVVLKAVRTLTGNCGYSLSAEKTEQKALVSPHLEEQQTRYLLSFSTHLRYDIL